MVRAAAILSVLLALARAAAAQPAPPPVDSARVVELRLTDGSTLAGLVVAAGDTAFVLRTPAGLRVVVPRGTLAGWRVVRGTVAAGRLRRSDPNADRLFFAPTARTLPRGDGYFGDYYLLIPTVGYGLTDRLTLAAGMSIIPGVALDEQVYFVAPKLSLVATPELGLAAGVLYAAVGVGHGGGSGGIAYGVTTVGDENAAVTFGLGWPFVVGEGGSRNPWAMAGGEARVSERLKLLVEAWKLPGATELPATFGVRFIGDRLGVDFGFTHVFGSSESNWPLFPWVDFVVHW